MSPSESQNSPGGRDTLTRRASLTLLSSALKQVARLIVVLAFFPVIVRGLGPELYGAYAVIQQGVGYLAAADLRAAGTLKFSLATLQHLDDIGQKQRQIGAAVAVWVCTLPLLLALAVLAIFFGPTLIDADANQHDAIRVAIGVVAATLVLDRILSIPAHVLRGVNLDYKSMGLDAGTILVGGFMSAVAIWLDLGLVGVTAAGLAGMLLTNGLRYIVARKHVPWMRPRRPAAGELRSFARMSGWFLIGEVGSLLLLSSEIVIVGLILGTVPAAVYATTQIILRIATGPIVEILASGGPGIALLCARREWDRVNELRLELQRTSIGLMTVIACSVLALNHSFLDLWIGPRYYGGDALNVWLVAGAFFTVLFRTDGVIADAMLSFRNRGVATMLAGAVSIPLTAGLGQRLGLVGIAAGACTGRMFLAGYVPRLISQTTGQPLASVLVPLARPLATAVAVMVPAYLAEDALKASTWTSLVLTGVVVSTGSCLAWWVIGLSRLDRARYFVRIRESSRRLPGIGK